MTPKKAVPDVQDAIAPPRYRRPSGAGCHRASVAAKGADSGDAHPELSTFETTEPNEFLDQLEKLVVRLLARRFGGPRSLWRMQLRLLDVQRNVQKAITTAKKDKSEESHRRLGDLRAVKWHARRFGDALAWVFFRNDRRAIDSLSWNAKVPVPPDGDGARGLIAAAEGLSQRMGFPLLHDITDVLRVGDISFFKETGRPETVEIKSTVVGTHRRGTRTLVKFEVTAIWPAGATPPSEVPRKPSAPRMRPNARVGRQLERLSRAFEWRVADVGTPTIVGGRKTLILEAKGVRRTTDPWVLLRRMIRRARRTGYASAVVDGVVMYAALYNKDGLETPELLMGEVPSDLVASGIFLEDRSRNSVWILGLPDTKASGPHRYLPYFLLTLPLPWIIDILRGRLVIVAMFNPGKIALALEELGMTTKSGKGKSYLRVFTDFEFDGGRYLAELPGLNDTITEMILEGRGLDHLLEVAETLASGIQEQLPGMMQEGADET